VLGPQAMFHSHCNDRLNDRFTMHPRVAGS